MGVLLVVVCGFLVGGAYSLFRQGRRLGGVILAVAAVLAGVGAALYLVPS